MNLEYICCIIISVSITLDLIYSLCASKNASIEQNANKIEFKDNSEYIKHDYYENEDDYFEDDYYENEDDYFEDDYYENEDGYYTFGHYMFKTCYCRQCNYLGWFYYYKTGNSNSYRKLLHELYKSIPKDTLSEPLIRFKYFYDMFEYALISLQNKYVIIGTELVHNITKQASVHCFTHCRKNNAKISLVLSLNGFLEIYATDTILCFVINDGLEEYCFARNKLTEPKNFPPTTNMTARIHYVPGIYGLI